jgi:hypothetical protein
VAIRRSHIDPLLGVDQAENRGVHLPLNALRVGGRAPGGTLSRLVLLRQPAESGGRAQERAARGSGVV